MKRVLCAIFAAAMLLSLTACGGTTQTPQSSTIGDGSKEQLLTYDLPVPADYAVSEEEAMGVELADYSTGIALPKLPNATIEVMMSIDWAALQNGNNEADPYAQYHATLMWRKVYADQGGDVKIVTITENNQTDYVATGTASGNAPDIIPANYDLTYPRWNAAGLTASVEKYADYLGLYDKDPNEPDKDLYNQELMNTYFQWGNESHGAITLDDVTRNYIVYNKSKFELAGETTPLEHWQNGNWTWTQFVETAKNMTSGDDFGFTGWALFPYFAPYAMCTIDPTTSQATLHIDDPNFVLYMTEVYNLYQVDGAARRDYALQNWATLFPYGTDAMVQTTEAGYKSIVEKAKKVQGDTFGIAPVPAFDPAGETVGIPTATLWAYSISAASDNPEGAATYIRLETLVSRNVGRALEGKTWFDLNYTEDEKAMIAEIEKLPVCMETIRGLGKCYDIIDTSIVPPLYYQETQDSVKSVFDANRNMLENEFAEFNQDVADLQ